MMRMRFEDPARLSLSSNDSLHNYDQPRNLCVFAIKEREM